MLHERQFANKRESRQVTLTLSGEETDSNHLKIAPPVSCPQPAADVVFVMPILLNAISKSRNSQVARSG